MKLFSSPSLLGLDIQPSSIRLILLKTHKNCFFIEKAAIYDLPPTIFIADNRIKAWEALGHVLTECVEILGLENQAVNVLLPATLVKMEHLKLPQNVTEEHIISEIKLHLAHDPVWINEALAIDFMKSKALTSNEMEVFFVATSQEYLEKYKACVTKAGLNVKIIEVDVHALKRAEAFPIPFAEVKMNSMIDEAFVKAHALDFKLAFGAAMREVPAW